MFRTYLKKSNKSDVPEAVIKEAARAVPERGFPQELQLPDMEWPIQRYITELKKNQQWWRAQSAHSVYFKLRKSVIFQ